MRSQEPMKSQGRSTQSKAVISGAVCIALVLAFGITRNWDGITKQAEAVGSGGHGGARAKQVETPPVQVIVTKLIPEPGRYVYRYTVVNGSAFPITDILIGSDHTVGVDELRRAPIGWNGVTVPPGSYKAPPGWNFQNVTTEEDTLGHLKWDIARTGEEILGGASLAGFEVTLGSADLAYEAGHWTVYLNTSEEPLYTGGLQPSGVTAVPVSSAFAKSDLRVTPNPASRSVAIQFVVPTAGVATVDVFDAHGRLVKRVMRKQTAVGSASAAWDGRDEAGKDVAAGVYFVRVKTLSTVRFSRVTLVR